MARRRLNGFKLKETPIIFRPKLAAKVGVTEAIIVERIRFLSEESKIKRTLNGEAWVRISANELQESLPFLSKRLVERKLSELQDAGVLIAKNHNKNAHDRTLWRRVNDKHIELLDDNNSSLLKDKTVLTIHSKLALSIGINNAIFLEQIDYWVQQKKHKINDYYWVYNTYNEWQEQFPFWSISTIKRTLSDLKSKEILIVDSFNRLKIDRTNWYSINYDKVQFFLGTGNDEEKAVEQNEEAQLKTKNQKMYRNSQSEGTFYTEYDPILHPYNEPVLHTFCDPSLYTHGELTNNQRNKDLYYQRNKNNGSSSNATYSNSYTNNSKLTNQIDDTTIEINIQNLNQLWIECFGIQNMQIVMGLKELVSEFGNELTQYAINQTALRGIQQRNAFNYVKKILENLKLNGIKTIEQAKAQQNKQTKLSNINPQIQEGFDRLWEKYPNKDEQDKQWALKAYSEQLTEGKSNYDQLDFLLEKYITDCKQNPWRKVMKPSSWFGGRYSEQLESSNEYRNTSLKPRKLSEEELKEIAIEMFNNKVYLGDSRENARDFVISQIKKSGGTENELNSFIQYYESTEERG